MRRFYKWLRMVVTGWYISRFGTPPPFAARRLAICDGCAFNSKNVKRLIKFRAPYCTLCKCDLKALAASDGGKCKMNKWPPPFDLDELIENLIK